MNTFALNLLLGLALASGAEASTYSILDLGAGGLAPADTATNQVGQVVGTTLLPTGLHHAFRTGDGGIGLTDLGTLGGDESWAYAINPGGLVVGSAQDVTGDAHAFRFVDGEGMVDLGNLGGYASSAFGINSAGWVVGRAETDTGETHGFVWSPLEGMLDLDVAVPVNSGWKVTEARSIDDAGRIEGIGWLHGEQRRFRAIPHSGPDLDAPVGVVESAPVTEVSPYAHLFTITLWDDVGVMASTVVTNAFRVTGPNGFDQPIGFSGLPRVTANGVLLRIECYVLPPDGLWSGAGNGTYSVRVESDAIRDVAGNGMSAGVLGTFEVATETRPQASLQPPAALLMNAAATFTLGGVASFPHVPGDLFSFTLDWEGDGTVVERVVGPDGTPVDHRFTSVGLHTIRLSVIDGHGVAGADLTTSVYVTTPPFPNAWGPAPALPGVRRLAVGLNAGGTLFCLGGLPGKGGLQVEVLPPGAAAFEEARRLNVSTTGLGAGVDSLGRVLVFGGIDPGAATPTRGGFVYTPSGGAGASIPSKLNAVHDFAFCSDPQGRIYAFGGSTGAALLPATGNAERFDAGLNAWQPLAPMPEARTGATATYDGAGHVLVIGGFDGVSGIPTSSLFSYDIATDRWTRLGDVPLGAAGGSTGRVAALGADGMVYLIGGLNLALFGVPEVLMFDPRLQLWIPGPSLSVGRGTPAVALGNDGFLYAIGGDAPAGGGGANNGLSSVERLDTVSHHAPRIVSNPAISTLQVGTPFHYQMVATGNPRPAFSLVTGPAGTGFDASTGTLDWVPGPGQVGAQLVRVRATSGAGVAEQQFSLTVTPIPTDTIPPTAPTNLFAVFRSQAGMTFTWSPATDNVGVVSYSLWNLTGGRNRHWGRVATGITNRAVHFPVSAFSPSFAVSAVDAAGNESPRSEAFSANSLTLPLVVHDVPSETATVIVGSSFLYTLSASATPSPTFTRLEGPAGMVLSRTGGANPSQDYAVVQWMPSASQVGTNYFTVYATNAHTSGAGATFAVLVLPSGTDLGAPTSVARMTADLVSYDRCTLSWTPAGDNVGVALYRLTAVHFGAPGQGNQTLTMTVPGGVTNTLLTGLLASSGYTLSIVPVDGAGNAGPATSIFITTLAAPAELLLGVAPGVTPGTLILRWTGLAPGTTYLLESTDQLSGTGWGIAGAPGEWPSPATQAIVPVDPTLPQRFYRVRPSL